MARLPFAWLLLATCALSASCAVGTEDGLVPATAGTHDGGADASLGDAAITDGASPDGSTPDATIDTTVDTALVDTALPDAGVTDTTAPDGATTDTGGIDTGTPDTGTVDSAPPDGGALDTGATDAGSCVVRGCATGTESRAGCANARTIGRTVAASSSGYTISDDLCTASNKFDESGSSCWDANADHAYRLWMRAGETVSLDVSTSWPCSFDLFTWYATLKIIENTGCDDTACTTRTFCAYNKTSHKKTFVAPRDGWYVFVVEGSSAFDDEGDYTFKVKLTCNEPDCGC